MGDEYIRNQMTEISAKHWDFLVQENLTAKEAVAFLKSGMQLRSFSDILRVFYPEPDLEKRLIAKMTEYDALQDMAFGVAGDAASGMTADCEVNGKAAGVTTGKGNRAAGKADSIRRKVQNWLRDKNLPTDREDVFRIAFALGFDENVTNRLLEQVFDLGIHYRNEREVVYAFSLRNHQSYATARKCADAFEMRKPKGAGAAVTTRDTGSDGVLSRQSKYAEEPVMATQMMHLAFDRLPPGEDIMDFMLRHSGSFGAFHNTAYRYFTEMLDLLTGEAVGEEAYSVDFVAQEYLRMNMPEDKRTSAYDNIQKMIKKYWPGVRNIRLMKAKKEDISRKVLLLLYIVTGGVVRDGYDELDEGYFSAEETLEEHCRRLNDMLNDCGMRRIDPRNPFDYLVMYCLKPEGDAFMSERMEEIVAELFDAQT